MNNGFVVYFEPMNVPTSIVPRHSTITFNTWAEQKAALVAASKDRVFKLNHRYFGDDTKRVAETQKAYEVADDKYEQIRYYSVVLEEKKPAVKLILLLLRRFFLSAIIL